MRSKNVFISIVSLAAAVVVLGLLVQDSRADGLCSPDSRISVSDWPALAPTSSYFVAADPPGADPPGKMAVPERPRNRGIIARLAWRHRHHRRCFYRGPC